MARYEQYITNGATGETVLIKSNDPVIFQSKIERKRKSWARQKERFEKQKYLFLRSEKAKELTNAAQDEIKAYETLLRPTLKVNHKINWKKFKNRRKFKEYLPGRKPVLEDFLKENLLLSLFDFIPYFREIRLEKEQKAKGVFELELEKYELEEKARLEKYRDEKEAFLKKQTSHNDKVDEDQNRYETFSKQGVERYFSLVLENSEYPDSLNIYPEVSYEPNSKILLVDMDLPNPSQVPLVKEFRYVKVRDEIDKKEMGKKEFESFYNGVLFQITLRTIYEVYDADYKEAVSVVVFNGWVEGVDPKTGKDFRNCVVSIQVSKEEFEEINLGKVEPRECFRYLKGVTAGSLARLAPVRPIMVLRKEDKRIISADSVLEGMEEHRNLATMDWLEFEILIRDLFQKEFSHEGCTVEVTRASRDEGVDGIAFDEDPIRGGKYILQTKRYNNLVPVSAVRDLYGTVVNEGAVKGILITTSYYGKAALEFAKDKPLKLINGEELLYLFNKHGYKFKIELTKKQRAGPFEPY